MIEETYLMSEIRPERAGEVVLGLLDVLAGAPSGLRWDALFSRLQESVPASPNETGSPPFPIPLNRYDMVARFCSDRAMKAGWIIRVDDRLLCTDLGLEARKNYPTVGQLGHEVIRLYHQWRRNASSVDFFISFAGHDKAWADWIAWTLDIEGYSIIYQPWDFLPGSNFVLEMDRIGKATRRLLAVLSPSYLESNFALAEWSAAFTRDPSGRLRILAPVRVENCDLTGSLLSAISYIDLVGIKEEVHARRALLEGLREVVPSERPEYPPVRSRKTPKPLFPPLSPPEGRDPASDSAGGSRESFSLSTRLPFPGIRVSPSPEFSPPRFTGLRIYPDDPLALDFLLSPGEATLTQGDLLQLAARLTKYFLASVTIPEQSQWVNMSPLEEGKVIDPMLARTDLGRDLLIQDYVLKQLAVSLTYPERSTGRQFWAEVFEEISTAGDELNTYNKVWIIPESADVVQSADLVIIADCHLRTMMEEDYLVLAKQTGRLNAAQRSSVGSSSSKMSGIFRETLLAYIERDVNEGSNFSLLRQIFHSMILAVWYKQALRDSLLGELYVDKTRTGGLEIEDKEEVEIIFAQWIDAYRCGVFEYIREDYDRHVGEILPKKYFSGGFMGAGAREVTRIRDVEPNELFGTLSRDDLYWVKVRLVPATDERWADVPTLDELDVIGGIDLDPRKGFELRVKGNMELRFGASAEVRESLQRADGGLRPLIIEIASVE